MRRARMLQELQSDAGKSADGASRPADGRRRRRRHDVGARRARRHDPQAAAIARPHLPAGPGPAARPPARAARSAGPARPAGQQGDQQMGDLREQPAGAARSAQEADGRIAEARLRPARASKARARWISSARPARPWARPKASSAKAMPMAPSTRKGRALEALRRGAQNLAQSMQQQGMMGPAQRPARAGWAGARAAGDRSARPAVARPRLRRRHHREGAGRNRRAARAPHSRRIAPPLRRDLPPAARARIYRAAAARLLSQRRCIREDLARRVTDPSARSPLMVRKPCSTCSERKGSLPAAFRRYNPGSRRDRFAAPRERSARTKARGAI